jgi:alpha-galactosidase
MITFNQDQRYFQIEGKGFSYIIGISPTGDLHHLHWGSKPSPHSLMKLLTEWRTRASEAVLIMENQRREFPDFGHNDLRNPAFQLEHADGSRISRFTYQNHEITPVKPLFEGPCCTIGDSRDEETLKIILRDELKNLELELFYTLYPQWNMVVKRAFLHNRGSETANLMKLMSTSLDLPSGDYQLVSFAGAWAHERKMQKQPLMQGTLRLESRRGIASHEMNPFVMVTRGAADEEKGEAYGMALAYSGNWLMEAETQRNGWLRLHMGLNDFNFKWRLDPGKSFFTPECALTYSPDGFGSLSLQYHRFIRQRVARGEWRDKPRPILINNWEATYFDFKHDDILRIAKSANEMGVELMVLDDGWFGERDKDDSSLGDWFEDKKKLPRGVKGLSEDVHGLGMKFGLWIEPEMISPRSKLYEEHPDWCLHVPGRDRLTFRTQLVLDMSRKEIREHLFQTIGKILEEGKVDYVKWDMNRALTEVGNEILPPDRQGELYHRYMMGVYDLMDRFNKRFPHILFEGCAGGGARFDLGVLSYHPQIWTSDNSDGLDRLFIQYGTSFCYPPVTMGAHIAASPNHITKRETPLKWRALMAMSGNFGLELDVTKWTVKEKKEVAGYIALYKEIRPLVQFGDFHRLESPYDSERASWMFVNEAKTEALLFIFQVKPFKKGLKAKSIRLYGLNPTKRYEIQGEKLKTSGKKLMKEGWLPKNFRKLRGNYNCEFFRLRMV